MKKFQKIALVLLPLSLFALFAMLTLNGCKKEEKCQQICNNGGVVNQNCDCDCDCGYTGTSCDDEQTPVTMFVDRVVVTQYPVLDDGDAWDDLQFPLPQEWPDLKIKVWRQDASGDWTITLGESDIIVDDPPNGLDKAFDMNLTLANPTDLYRISLYDHDFDLDPGGPRDEFMGGTNFTPFTGGGGFPYVVTLTSSNGLVVMEVHFKYEFADGCVRQQ